MTDPGRRWMSAALGGGSLLDLGIYPLSLIHHLLGPPRSFEANAHLAATGVDVDTRVISHHAGEASAVAAATFTASTANEAIVSGRDARIRIHTPFYHSRTLTLERDREVVATYETDFEGHGFRFEVAEAERCTQAGLPESPLRPHADTLAVMEWMDAVRQRCGVAYPGDRP
jgi:predicted dehydrogenase